MKWDRQQSTDKERGNEKEQEEESCMMQTCDKKLQKQGKQQPPCAECISQQCRECIYAYPCAELCCTPQTRRRFLGKGCSLQPSICHGAQVQPQPLRVLGAHSEKSRSVVPVHSCLCVCVCARCRAPSNHRQSLKGRLANSTKTASPQTSLKSFILQGKEKVKRQTTERRRLA